MQTRLSTDELNALRDKATGGDMDAARKLLHHYLELPSAVFLVAPEELQEMLMWAKMLAEDGDAEGQCFVAFLNLGGGFAVQKNLEVALIYGLLAAEQNFDRAYGVVGEALLLLRRYAEAVPWLERAVLACPDWGKAFLNLGGCFLLGLGVSQDSSRAEHLLRRAAELGMTEAAYKVAEMLMEPYYPLESQAWREAPPEKAAEVVKYLKLACPPLEEYPPACWWLAYAYETGWGVGSDFAKARAYYSAGALRDKDPSCHYRLANLCAYGRGGEVDISLAVSLLQEAARMGHEQSQVVLRNQGLPW